jgi:hypothetical protein
MFLPKVGACPWGARPPDAHVERRWRTTSETTHWSRPAWGAHFPLSDQPRAVRGGRSRGSGASSDTTTSGGGAIRGPGAGVETCRGLVSSARMARPDSVVTSWPQVLRRQVVPAGDGLAMRWQPGCFADPAPCWACIGQPGGHSTQLLGRPSGPARSRAAVTSEATKRRSACIAVALSTRDSSRQAKPAGRLCPTIGALVDMVR